MKSPELLEPFYQLILIFASKNPRPLLDLVDNLLVDLFRSLNTIIKSGTGLINDKTLIIWTNHESNSTINYEDPSKIIFDAGES